MCIASGTTALSPFTCCDMFLLRSLLYFGLAQLSTGTVKTEVFYVEAGNVATLPCNLMVDTTVAQPTLIWERGETKIMVNDRVLRRHDHYEPLRNVVTFDLIIHEVEPLDSGHYRCYLSEKPSHKHVVMLKVQVPPTVEMVPAISPYYADWGSHIPLTCFAKGNPTPTVTWTRDGGQRRLPNKQWSRTGNTLVLYKVHDADDGNYSCSAANGVGRPATATIDIVVTRKPQITAHQKFSNPKHNMPLDISCVFRAKPVAQVKWYFEGALINPHKKPEKYHENVAMNMDGSSTASLRIANVTEKDYGEYSCLVENQVGKAQQSTYVSPVPRAVTLSDVQPGVEAISLKWMIKAKTKLTGFRIQFVEESDFDEIWKSVEVPAEKPSNSGVYVGRHVLEGLESNTTYLLRVQARNRHGWGNLPAQPTSVRTLVLPPTTVSPVWAHKSHLIVVSRGYGGVKSSLHCLFMSAVTSMFMVRFL